MINGCPTQKGDSKAEGRRARARPEKNLTRDLFEGESCRIKLAKVFEGGGFPPAGGGPETGPEEFSPENYRRASPAG